MHLWINEPDCSRWNCTSVDSIIYVSFHFIMKCRVSEVPSTSWHRIRYPRNQLAKGTRPSPKSFDPFVQFLVFFFVFSVFFFFCFFFPFHYLSSIIRNTQFRRLTKPPSYQPRPASRPILLSSRFCFRDLLIWLNPTAPLRFPSILPIRPRNSVENSKLGISLPLFPLLDSPPLLASVPTEETSSGEWFPFPWKEKWEKKSE